MNPSSSLKSEKRERERSTSSSSKSFILPIRSRTSSDNPVRAPEDQKKEKTDSSCQESSLSTRAYPHTIRPSSPFLPHNHHPTHPPTPTQPSPTSCKEKVIIIKKKKKSLENANKFCIYSFIHPSIRSLSHSPPFSQRFVAPRFSSIYSTTSETKVIQ